MQLEVRELGEYYIVEVVTLQSEPHRVIESHVDELTLFLVDDIVVTNQLLVSLGLAHLIGLVGDATRNKCITDTYEAFLYKVHLINFLVFIVNYLIVQVVLKTARQEALGDLEQEAYVLLLVQ